MANETFTIKLADGSLFEKLELNGNNYISKKKLTEDMFEGKLSKVEITNDSTKEAEVLNDAVLVQIAQYGKEYWVVFAEKSEAEKEREDLLADIEAQAQAIEELASIIGDL